MGRGQARGKGVRDVLWHGSLHFACSGYVVQPGAQSLVSGFSRCSRRVCQDEGEVRWKRAGEVRSRLKHIVAHKHEWMSGWMDVGGDCRGAWRAEWVKESASENGSHTE